MDTIVKYVGAGVLIFALVVVFSLLAAYPTMWLVNYLITPSLLTTIFGISALTFWKAFWLNFLASALFKSSSVSSK
jgi:hypothetical protein